MICQVCGARVTPEEWTCRTDAFPYGEGVAEQCVGIACPVCGSEALADVTDCRECGNEFPKEEVDDGLCRVCCEELRQTLLWMAEQLTPPQKQWVTLHPDWIDMY